MRRHCGLRSVYMSWSAAEYIHMVMQRNHTALPPEALFVLRFQKAYSLTRGAYTELMDDYDTAMLPWLAAFQVLPQPLIVCSEAGDAARALT